jgi:hypothetical protein
MKNRSTKDTETNTNATTANFRKSPSNLAERSIKNVAAKVITSVEGVIGEKHSLYFFKISGQSIGYRYAIAKYKAINQLQPDEIHGTQ